MIDETWHVARLIPTSGISGAEEAERRATSALLAVMGAVREFGAAIVRPLGAPAGQLSTFIEVPFTLEDRKVIPDGLLTASRGSRQWTTLVEVKTGSSELEREQVECYLDVAREQGFDAVLTISNQIAPAPGIHPVEVDKRKLRKVALHHLSWAEVLTVAVQQRVHRGVADPEQAWILGELIRYLEHPKSGALDFSDMGSSWVAVRDSIALGTLRLNDKGLSEVVSRWEQLLRFAALRLGRELGAKVDVAVTRREASDPAARLAAQAQSLVTTGVLTGTFKIPGSIAPLNVSVDLRANRVTASVDVDAPRDGRPTTRINWLVRQLRDADDRLRVDAFTVSGRQSTSEVLAVLRERPENLLDGSGRELKAFRITATSTLGTKRGTGRGAFIDSVLAAVDGFYSAVVQKLRPWTAKVPQLPKGHRTAAEEAGLELSTPPRDLVDDDETAAEEGSAAVDVEIVEPAADPDGDGVDLAATAPASSDVDLVSWEEAHERLDHERQLDSSTGELSSSSAA